MGDEKGGAGGGENGTGGRHLAEELDGGRYRIGSVSDLTGIPTHTLRAWERRYGASDPERTEAGFRLYTEEDVGRLTLIKRLSDLGHAIGSIANLSLKELQERLARVEERGWRGGGAPASSPRVQADGPVPVVLLDAFLEAQVREAGGEATGLAVVASPGSLDELWTALRGRESGERVVVLAGLPRLGPAPTHAIRRLREEPGVAQVVVLYEFAPRKLLRQLILSGARLVQGWPGVESLRRIIRETAGTPRVVPLLETAVAPSTNGHPPGGSNPPRVFSDPDLGRLREVDSAVDCECPNHMAQLVAGLVAFEEYSRDCESRDARDAELHAHLHRETGRARAIMERALLHLCQEEGIEL